MAKVLSILSLLFVFFFHKCDLRAQSESSSDSIIYHVFPRLERYLTKRINRFSPEIQKALVISLDDKYITLSRSHINYDESHLFVELDLCYYVNFSVLNSTRQMRINGKLYPVYFRATDATFTQSDCNVNMRKYGGLPFSQLEFSVAEWLVVDIQRKRFYTSRSKWIRKQ